MKQRPIEIHHETTTSPSISWSSNSNRNETYHLQHKLEYPTWVDKKLIKKPRLAF